MTNKQRAAYAETAIKAFLEVCKTDREDAITDLVTDLMHLARRDGADPYTIVRTAQMHFEAEENGEE
jgi:hypothetical protein